ncbi:unnamed protein product [Pelagomonas calceolata]|uniref:Elongation factor Ts, mitochondrial n=1 Tax=Pelagomonas calceolata TaxID=35677 RepID=A0A8J2SFN5_9STRA|nr:unnamed protein product [Pelagomonas calceolata]
MVSSLLPLRGQRRCCKRPRSLPRTSVRCGKPPVPTGARNARKTAPSNWSRGPLGRASSPAVRCRRDAIAATQKNTQHKNAGAGMMDCKKALVEADGDVEKASEWLRVKGLASAAKKGERATKEGLIETYVHTGGKLGVMVEVNCETDFVSKGDKFKELCKMLAMQIAACPGVEYVKAEDISEEARAKERALEMKSEDLEGKPEAIKEKMVEGRVNKMFKEKILLDQKYIKDDSMTVADFVASYVAVLGENIQVARFGTFRLGETQDA